MLINACSSKGYKVYNPTNLLGINKVDYMPLNYSEDSELKAENIAIT